MLGDLIFNGPQANTVGCVHVGSFSENAAVSAGVTLVVILHQVAAFVRPTEDVNSPMPPRMPAVMRLLVVSVTAAL